MSPIALLRSFAADRQLRNVDVRRFWFSWFSSALTNFGAQITLLALPICAALLLHATPAQMGTLAAAGSLPFLLFSLPTGVLLDRSRRPPVMLSSDAMVALSLASVPFAWWQGWLSVHWLYAVQFMLGAGFVVGGSAEQIFLTFLVGRDGVVVAAAGVDVGLLAPAVLWLHGAVRAVRHARAGHVARPDGYGTDAGRRRRAGELPAVETADAALRFRRRHRHGPVHLLPRLHADADDPARPVGQPRRHRGRLRRRRILPRLRRHPVLPALPGAAPARHARRAAGPDDVDDAFHDGGLAPIDAAGAGALAERLGVRGGLTVVAAGALLLTLTTLFGTRLHKVRQ